MIETLDDDDDDDDNKKNNDHLVIMHDVPNAILIASTKPLLCFTKYFCSLQQFLKLSIPRGSVVKNLPSRQ